MEGAGEGPHGMTGTEWRVATALFTAGEVSVMVLGKVILTMSASTC